MSRSLATLVASTFLGWTGNAAKDMAVASFSAANTGVEGYVKVTNGILELNLDFSGVTDAALDDDCLTDMTYHIHESYDHANLTDRLGSKCGRPITGNHWDPWLGCGAATDNDYCQSDSQSSVPGGGCVTGSSVLGDSGYSCSTANFATNPYSCEVGDWGGKYGRFTPDSSGMVQATYTSAFETTASDLEGLSVVFHCGDDGSRAFCAGFEFTEGEGDEDRPAQTGGYNMLAYLDAVSASSMVLLETNGDVSIDVDPTGLTIPSGCGDLLLRVYEDWTYDGTSTTENCGNYTGYFYDPTASCAWGSGNEFCDGDQLCSDGNYTYMCDTAVFAMPYDRFNCAPGDLTGKYGSLSSTTATSGWTGNDPLQIDLSLLMGRSLVLQCANTYEMLACAGFNAVADDMSSTMTPDDDKAFTMSVQFGTIMVMMTSVGLMFL